MLDGLWHPIGESAVDRRGTGRGEPHCPVMTLPGSAVGAGGAMTVGVNEFGPPGVRVGAFSVGEAGGPEGGGPLGEGLCWVGSGVFVGSWLSRSVLQPAIHVAAPAIATPPISTPTRRIVVVFVMVSSFETRRLVKPWCSRARRCYRSA